MNDYQPGHLAVPTIFSYAKKSGLSCCVFVAKPKLRPLVDPADVELFYAAPVPENWDSEDVQLVRRGVRQSYEGLPDTTANGIAGAFAKEWPAGRFELAMIHFREPDVAGHKHGWMGEEYLRAVSVCDSALGRVLDAIGAADRGKHTAIVVTSDHGGVGRFHHKELPENNTIPWICVGAGVPQGVVIEREVQIADTAPTILKLLGLPVPDGLDGKVIEDVFTR
jgi:bisphosphoglycerate-independent phosphoglycerate mutase (AlkP superfamily)